MQYDPAGWLTRLSWGGGLHGDYQYDLPRKMTAMRENGAGSRVAVLATYGYDDLGRRTGIERATAPPPPTAMTAPRG